MQAARSAGELTAAQPSPAVAALLPPGLPPFRWVSWLPTLGAGQVLSLGEPRWDRPAVSPAAAQGARAVGMVQAEGNSAAAWPLEHCMAEHQFGQAL